MKSIRETTLRKVTPVLVSVIGVALICASGIFIQAQSKKVQNNGSQAQPGTIPAGNVTRKISQPSAAISPVVTENGMITLSIDALGTLSSTGTIDVQKPAGATVRAAYLAAASMGVSGRVLVNGDVKINGNDVIWSLSTAATPPLAASNHFANVTSIVKPIVDAAPAGIVSLTITEVDSINIDGEVLAVIFDDPNQLTSNSIILLFGAQNPTGDTFNITTSPLDPTKEIDMSLGISFSAQPAGQSSIVNVNGQRLTSSAGGQDDGELANGALMTAGGIGDSIANPANPFADDSGGTRTDDELYDLRPFVTANATNITVFTQNPSNDDNIFFAAFFFAGATAVINPGGFDACLQDDSNPSTVLLFNTTTGDYIFCCGGTSYTGTGSVTAKGSTFTLQHNAPDRRVLGKLDSAVNKGSASLQVPPGNTICTITDRDTTNNSCTCQQTEQ